MLVLLSMLTVSHALYPSSGPVLSLSKKTFKSQILESDLPAVVEFFAPWCGHCQQLTPVYTKVASNLQVALPILLFFLLVQSRKYLQRAMEAHSFCLLLVQGMVTVAAVDCDEEANKKLCSKYGVKGFPTIKVGTIPT